MTPNRLSREKSPYLLQHAHNPVDWYAWGEEAFQKARTENKPIFLSIGYSTCHWCHVMERESFESDEVAEVLNRSFVPIKVDREERPDVDRIYMTFVQATTGSGGWPMSVWLTPDLKPFFGGTYFPPDSRYGRPGFRSILEQLALAWQTDRAKIVESGDHVLQEIEKHVRASGPAYAVDPAVLDSAFYQFRRSFDSKLGGFGGAPKFPRAVSFNFLLRYHKRSRNDEALEMTLVTLREMAKGGMNDQIGGGFHRYSVDARWFVPHFEKMLYDQAQLAISYVEAYQITGEPEFADTARRVLDYVLRDMTDPAGGFYSAEDADSVIDPANPKEKGEGAFYIWSDQEMRAVLESPVVDWFSFRYGVESGGNVNEDPHQEFTGKNILYQRRSIEETAKRFGVSSDAVGEALEQASQKLLQARSTRIRPHLDDKILTAWNGLMISAFAKGALALKEPRYLAAASGAAAFVQSELYRDGVLLRRYRDGEAAIHGFLDDYSYFGLGLVDLYEASFDRRWLDLAAELARKMISLFEDAVGGGFFSSPEGDTSLVMRIKEDYDGAEPSGNSMAILLLLRLSAMLGDAQFREVADKALRAFASRIGSQPTGMPQMLVAFLLSLTPPKQIVLAGEAIEPLRDVLAARFLPEHALLRSGHTATEYPEVNGKAAAYVCENFACKLPVTEASELQALLQ